MSDVAGTRETLGNVIARCPYRSLLGSGGNADEMLGRVRSVIAVLGGDPEPLSETMLRDAIACIRAGDVVLLISDQPRLRDYAKREILGMAAPAEGRA